jgi:hypothetical protein
MGSTEKHDTPESIIPSSKERGGAVLTPSGVLMKIWNLMCFDKWEEALLCVDTETQELYSLVEKYLPAADSEIKEYCVSWVKEECLRMGLEIGTDGMRDLMNTMYFNKLGKVRLWVWITRMDNEGIVSSINNVKTLERAKG